MANHKIIELFESEGIFNCRLVQLSCKGQRHPQLKHVVQYLVHFDFDCVQGWVLQYISGQLVPVLRYPCCNNLFPYIQSKNLQSISLKPFPLSYHNKL